MIFIQSLKIRWNFPSICELRVFIQQWLSKFINGECGEIHNTSNNLRDKTKTQHKLTLYKHLTPQFQVQTKTQIEYIAIVYRINNAHTNLKCLCDRLNVTG